jgi:hypothetical protein
MAKKIIKIDPLGGKHTKMKIFGVNNFVSICKNDTKILFQKSHRKKLVTFLQKKRTSFIKTNEPVCSDGQFQITIAQPRFSSFDEIEKFFQNKQN